MSMQTSPLRFRCLASSILGLLSLLISQPLRSAPGDCWLEFYGLYPYEWNLDHDRDGASAREEYFAATDPFDASSNLKLDIRLEDEQVILDWDSNMGATYEVRGSTQLEDIEAITESIPGNDDLVEVLLGIEESREFFELHALGPTDSVEDGLSDVQEALFGTNPMMADSDGDEISDGDEVCRLFTDPLTFNSQGGTLRGLVLNDPENTGDLADGVPLPNAMVYLDANFNARFDPGECTELSGAENCDWVLTLGGFLPGVGTGFQLVATVDGCSKMIFDKSILPERICGDAGAGGSGGFFGGSF